MTRTPDLDIAALYSPFTLSLLPLSTGSSLPFLRNLLSLSFDQYTLTSSLHCSPADSLEIHRILGAERSVGIHWGTFCHADEARGTRVEFGRRRRDFGVKGSWEGDGEMGEAAEGKGRFVVCDIGETLVFPI
jgi:N-acyl-phosphatidylethanolamine-hydrolysing phospholipase D